MASAPRDIDFGFNSPEFSDKLLRLEVVAHADSTVSVTRKRQRSNDEDGSSPDRLVNLSKKQMVDERVVSNEQHTNKSVEMTEFKCNEGVSEVDNPMLMKEMSNKPLQDVDNEDDVEESGGEKSEDDVEESGGEKSEDDVEESGGEKAVTPSDYSNEFEMPILRVKEIFICSLILASESSYFKKLFVNGMKETEKKVVTIQVTEAEADAVEELIVFAYKRKFNKTEPDHLLRVLVAADKYQVTRALIFCGELMLRSEMTAESAVMYLDFDSSNSAPMDDAMRAVKAAARDFLVTKFKEVTRYEQDLLKMPLSAIKCIFSSSELEAPCEDYIYDFLVKWAREQYSDVNQCMRVFTSDLLGLIRFVHMPLECLRKVLDLSLRCNFSDGPTGMKMITINALVHKTNSSILPIRDWNYDQRAYLVKPLRFTCLHTHPEAVAYMELTLRDCIRMTTSGNVNNTNSQMFLLAGQIFFLSTVIKFDLVSKLPTTLGFFVGVNQSSQPFPVTSFVLSVRQNPAAQFVTKVNSSTNFSGSNLAGHPDIFSCSFAQLIGEGSPFLIGGRLHFRAELTIKQP